MHTVFHTLHIFTYICICVLLCLWSVALSLRFPSLSLSHPLGLICWNDAECWNNVIISPDWCSILSGKQLAYSILLLWPSENDWCDWPTLSTSSITQWERERKKERERRKKSHTQRERALLHKQGHRFKHIMSGTFFFCFFLSETNQFNLWDKRLKALVSNFNTVLNTKYEHFLPQYAIEVIHVFCPPVFKCSNGDCRGTASDFKHDVHNSLYTYIVQREWRKDLRDERWRD